MPKLESAQNEAAREGDKRSWLGDNAAASRYLVAQASWRGEACCVKAAAGGQGDADRHHQPVGAATSLGLVNRVSIAPAFRIGENAEMLNKIGPRARSSIRRRKAQPLKSRLRRPIF